MSRSWTGSRVFFIVLGLLVSSTAAPAAGKIRLGASVFGGYNSYQMTDLNRLVQSDLDSFNVSIPSTGGKYSVDDVAHGAAFGAGLDAWVTNDIVVSAAYERLIAKNSNDGVVKRGPTEQVSYNVKYEVPADAFSLSATYFIPSASKLRFGLGAGVGYYSTRATIQLFEQSGSTGDFLLPGNALKGHGIGFHGVGAVDYAAAGPLRVDLRLGYRFARTTQLEDEGTGVVLQDAEGAKVRADWSGFMARAGLTVFLAGGQ
jgi:hypothetical protein